MDDIDLLNGVLTKTGDLIEGVEPDQRANPTPCPEYDVDALLDHIVGWVQVFEAGAVPLGRVEPRRQLAGARPRP